MKKLLLSMLGLALWAAPASAVVVSTPVGNANYTILNTDQRLLLTVPFTAQRTFTLPAAAATCVGQTCPAFALEILDIGAAINGTNTLVIAPQTGDTINSGAASASITITTGSARIVMIPITGTNWLVNVVGPNGQFVGTATNDNAAAGNVGEYVLGQSGTAASASASCTAASSCITSAPQLTTTVPTVVNQVLLSAGDWDCRSNVQLTPGGAAAVTVLSSWTSTTNPTGATPPTPGATGGIYGTSLSPNFTALQAASVTSPLWALSPATVRYSLSASTSVYQAVNATFSAGGLGAEGSLACRRMR